MRTVLVTGGGTGIGYAIAEAFVAAGDRVVITGRRADVLADACARLGVTSSRFDAADPAAVAAADLPSTVDVLVNNAGGNTDFQSDDGEDLEAVAARWNANWAANVLSAVLVTTAVTPRMPDGGRIITIGSIAARTGAGSYGAAKAGGWWPGGRPPRPRWDPWHHGDTWVADPASPLADLRISPICRWAHPRQ
jgi:3-oxoacyl-[acyl-carrier protein] reductase